MRKVLKENKMAEKYRFKLTPLERETLEQMIATGKAAARKLTHARILLKADSGEDGPNWKDEAISAALDVSPRTIARVRKRFVTEGLEAALNRRTQANHRPRRLDGVAEAHLIALACGQPPAGNAHWSLRLLADKMVELNYVEEVSYQTIRRTLKKTSLNRT
jgi:hypothetical protein